MFYLFLPFFTFFTEFYRVLPCFAVFYRVLPSFTEFYPVLPSFTQFYQGVLPSFTEFYRVLPSFTEFYRVYRFVCNRLVTLVSIERPSITTIDDSDPIFDLFFFCFNLFICVYFVFLFGGLRLRCAVLLPPPRPAPSARPVLFFVFFFKKKKRIACLRVSCGRRRRRLDADAQWALPRRFGFVASSSPSTSSTPRYSRRHGPRVPRLSADAGRWPFFPFFFCKLFFFCQENVLHCSSSLVLRHPNPRLGLPSFSYLVVSPVSASLVRRWCVTRFLFLYFTEFFFLSLVWERWPSPTMERSLNFFWSIEAIVPRNVNDKNWLAPPRCCASQ